MSMNGYQCFACSAIQAAEFKGFLCPVCGGNLDITYDYEAVAKELAGGFHQEPHDIFRFAALLPLKKLRPAFPPGRRHRRAPSGGL